MKIDKLKNSFVTGAWLTDVKQYFSKINEIVEKVNNIETPKYKVYSALLNQTGEDPPVATVLENTIGNIWFTYNYKGNYTISCDNLFIENKTFFLSQTTIDNTPQTISIVIRREDNNNSIIKTILEGSGEDDNWLNNTPIEIRVYN